LLLALLRKQQIHVKYSKNLPITCKNLTLF
jgi:hypothetical protein